MAPIVTAFLSKFVVIPIYACLDVYAKEKAKIRKKGLLIDDFDILIGVTAITHDLTLVTNNIAHLGRLENIIIENWTAS